MIRRESHDTVHTLYLAFHSLSLWFPANLCYICHAKVIRMPLSNTSQTLTRSQVSSREQHFRWYPYFDVRSGLKSPFVWFKISPILINSLELILNLMYPFNGSSSLSTLFFLFLRLLLLSWLLVTISAFRLWNTSPSCWRRKEWGVEEERESYKPGWYLQSSPCLFFFSFFLFTLSLYSVRWWF